MNFNRIAVSMFVSFALFSPAQAQSKFEAQLCEAAKTNRVVEMVYDKDKSKGCEPRLIDVHQVAIGNNGKLYMHGWQSRGCTKGRDYASKRIFRFDKIKSVEVIKGEFGEKSQGIKGEGWDGCIGSNCFIKENGSVYKLYAFTVCSLRNQRERSPWITGNFRNGCPG